MGFPTDSNLPAFRAFAVALVSGLLTFTSISFAQGAAEDPYGIGTPSASPATPTTPRADTVRPATPATPATSAADTAQVAPPVAATPDTTPRVVTPRPRITRETTVNPMDVKRGNYRNPKKALFMSLVIPGLGQAYIGQSTFNYVRAAAYFTADVTMGYMWYHYSVVKYDRKVKQYRKFADANWSQSAYESKITELAGVTDQSLFTVLNPNRISYCGAVQSRETTTGNNNYLGCIEPYSDNTTTQQNYSSFVNTTLGDDPSTASGLADLRARRAGFPDDVSFYEMIGANQEFISGWDDWDFVDPGYDLTSDSAWTGTSAHRNTYNSMRQTAKDYSRMQTWFLGGIVLNHIASAVDAAITARRHNKVLYEQGDARWYDKVNLDGGMAMDLGRPRTYMTAYLTF